MLLEMIKDSRRNNEEVNDDDKLSIGDLLPKFRKEACHIQRIRHQVED